MKWFSSSFSQGFDAGYKLAMKRQIQEIEDSITDGVKKYIEEKLDALLGDMRDKFKLGIRILDKEPSHYPGPKVEGLIEVLIKPKSLVTAEVPVVCLTVVIEPKNKLVRFIADEEEENAKQD